MKGLQLELIPENHKDIPENILDALRALEHILEKKKQRAVLFLDEFQEIAKIKISREIEGAIRHFAQKSKHVVFIFSGSSRHMLKHMFDDKSRPLYALCDEINLERLSKENYQPYFNKVAQRTFKKNLSNEACDKIIELTECHPRYVYLLCVFLWDYCLHEKKSPDVIAVQKTWELLLQDKLKDFREVLSQKTIGQIKLLTLIALGHAKELTGQNAQAKLGVSGSAITQGLNLLEKEEYIERLPDRTYRIIDPLLKEVFIRYGADYF